MIRYRNPPSPHWHRTTVCSCLMERAKQRKKHGSPRILRQSPCVTMRARWPWPYASAHSAIRSVVVQHQLTQWVTERRGLSNDTTRWLFGRCAKIYGLRRGDGLKEKRNHLAQPLGAWGSQGCQGWLRSRLMSYRVLMGWGMGNCNRLKWHFASEKKPYPPFRTRIGYAFHFWTRRCSLCITRQSH